MSRLIRFEDAYGMADLVCLAHGLGLVGLSSDSKSTSLSGVIDINYCEEKDTYYECGISFPTLLVPDNELLGNIKAYGVDELVFVYDMDSPKKGEQILSKVMLENYLKDLRKYLDDNGARDVVIKFVPVVWAAETFALYILACDYDSKDTNEIIVEPTQLIHTKNIAKFQGKIIDEYLKYYGIQGRAKHLREYINSQDVVIENLKLARKRFKESLNKKTMSWIIENKGQFLFDMTEAIQHQENVNKFYKNNQPGLQEVFDALGTKLNMNKKCW